MDLRLVLTFLEVIVFFGLLGWAIDIWLRTQLIFLYPAFGIVAFGVVAVPLTYLFGRFNEWIVLSSCALVVGLGIVGLFRFGLPHPRFLWRPRSIFLCFLSIVLVVLGLVQSSKYSIPGGIDSALHSSIINGTLVSGQPLRGTYPLGMHIAIFSSERLFHARQELVFLSLYLILYLSSIAGLAVIADRMIKRPMAGYIALAVGCIDVSLYNNLLNGSGTHLFGVVLTVLLILAAVLTVDRPTPYQYLGFSAVLTTIWYFHYPTLFFAVITLWAWQIVQPLRKPWLALAAFGTSIIVSLPFQIRQFQDLSYVQSIVPAMIGIILVEIVLMLWSKWISRLIFRRITLLVIAIASIYLFFQYLNAFLYIPTWYGVILVQLAMVGIATTILSRHPLGVMGLLSFAGVAVFHAVLHLPQIPGLSKVMIELVYYYGFTGSLILLAMSGMSQIQGLLPSRRLQAVIVGLGAVYIILIVSARSFDRPLLQPTLNKDQPISRYEQSSGFGIFYTRNDVMLANWVKEHIRSGRIANPGGLYNAWSPLTEHDSLWATYNVPTIADAEPVTANLKKLLQDDPEANVGLLIDRGIRYILLPENFSVTIYNPQVHLVYQLGQARFYELTPRPENQTWLPLPIGRGQVESKVTVATTGHYVCPYCGNTFYFTQQDILHRLKLEPGDTLTITLSKTLSGQKYMLYMDKTAEEVTVQVGKGDRQKVRAELIATAKPGEMVVMTNETPNTIDIQAMAWRQSTE